MKSVSRHRLRSKRRAGFALAGALVVLALVTIAIMAMVSRTTMVHRLAERRHQRIQAQWINEAAIDRALTRMQFEDNYEGEQWQLAATDVGDGWPAIVTIERIRQEETDEPATDLIKVTTVYAAVGERQIKQTKVVSTADPAALEEGNES